MISVAATQYEPGAMQYLEGLRCGLPVFFVRMREHKVCSKFGKNLIIFKLLKKN